MKCIALALPCALLLALCSCQHPEPTAAVPSTAIAATPAIEAPLGFLRAQGREIVDEEGRRVELRGCNIGSWLLIEPWMLDIADQADIKCEKDIWDLIEKRFGREAKLDLIKTYRGSFFTEDDVARIRKTGMNCLRVPIWWRAVSDPEFGGDMDYLDRCVRWCARNGVYAILDLHGAPGGQSSGADITAERTDGGLWKQEVFKVQTIDWWKTVAGRFKDEPAVMGYDLINEAFTAPYNDLMDMYGRLYEAIRGVDPRHILIIEDGLLGFYRMPRPAERGWTNVVYSFHYYPQTPEEGLKAEGTTLPAFNRAALQFDVPVLVGEFNTLLVERGGVDKFMRYREVFDFYGWAWTFWSFKKIEQSRDTIWGLVGYCDARVIPELQTASLEEIRQSFGKLRTENLGENELLGAALGASRRWADTAPLPLQGARWLDLRDASLNRAKGGDLRMEWGWTPPNAGYWKKGDTISWYVDVEADGVWEFGLHMANNGDGNRAQVWIDGVHAVDASLPNTKGWRAYRDASVGHFRLAKGPHTVEFGQADDAGAFINLRGAWIRPSSSAAMEPDGRAIWLKPGRGMILAKNSPIRVEWMNDPPNIGYWDSGAKASWAVTLPRNGRYQVQPTYSANNPKTVLKILVDDQPALSQHLAGTGGWHTFRSSDMGQVEIPAGTHTLSAIWQTPAQEGAGNMQGIYLAIQEPAAP